MTDGAMGQRAIAATAHALADEADARGGILTREARPDELAGALARFDATWGAGRTVDLASLKAIAHAGNTVLVAVPAARPPDASVPVGQRESFDSRETAPGGADSRESVSGRRRRDLDSRETAPGGADSRESVPEVPLGAALGFLGWAGGLHVHSHMNAVDPSARGRGIGVALKLRQRAICLEHGIDEVRWTYDPLIRRNARMNLVRLGAEVIAYHPDFYGELRDAISGGDRSDRFEVRWRLTSTRVATALARMPQPAWHAEGGLPLVADFEGVRAADPRAAAALRDASRAAFAVLADGRLRPELDASGDYVFTADDPDREPDRAPEPFTTL
jgi:hypothetical protein